MRSYSVAREMPSRREVASLLPPVDAMAAAMARRSSSATCSDSGRSSDAASGGDGSGGSAGCTSVSPDWRSRASICSASRRSVSARGQQRQRAFAQLRRGAAAQGHVFAQHFDQRGDVAAALAQRRHAHRQHVQAVVQVFAELAGLHQRLQIAAGGGDHARVKAHQLVAAQRLGLAVLQRAKQLGLQAWRHVADLVQKQRAAVGQLEFADAALALGAGVGTGGDAEELGLQQGIGHRRDVDADKRPAGPPRCGMDGVRQQFLAGAGFAQQQHRAARLRRAPRLALDFHRGRAGAHEARKSVARLP